MEVPQQESKELVKCIFIYHGSCCVAGTMTYPPPASTDKHRSATGMKAGGICTQLLSISSPTHDLRNPWHLQDISLPQCVALLLNKLQISVSGVQVSRIAEHNSDTLWDNNSSTITLQACRKADNAQHMQFCSLSHQTWDTYNSHEMLVASWPATPKIHLPVDKHEHEGYGRDRHASASRLL